MRKKEKEDSRFIDRVGEKYPTNEGEVAEVIECFGANRMTVRFEDGTVVKNRSIGNLRKGKLLNPNRRTLCGIGFIGLGKYSSSKNNKRTNAYTKWADMVKRCYNEKSQENLPTYRTVTIFEEWECFQNFAEWVEKNCNLETMKGWHLDKDILIKGNKIYSPETCCLVPQEINNLFIKSDKARGEYPIGVSKEKRRFKAELSTGKNTRIYLGTFNTPEEAFQTYKIAKELRIKEMADKYKKEIIPEVYQAMYNYQVEITD